MDDFVTIDLIKPITVDGSEVKALRMREPTVGDQLAMEKSGGTDSEKEVGMIAMLCMIAPADVNKLKLRDYKKVQAAFVSFLG